MSMIIWLEPFFTYLETFLVLCIRLSVQPMPFIFVQEDLERSDTPASLALLAKLAHKDEAHRLNGQPEVERRK